MIFRIAITADIDQMSSVRLSVRENRLSNPALITADDYRKFITVRGKGWVCETDRSLGFLLSI
jgi:hypothetical protein